MVLGFGDPTKGMTRILGHFVILDECECAILRLQIMLRRNKYMLLRYVFWTMDVDESNLDSIRNT